MKLGLKHFDSPEVDWLIAAIFFVAALAIRLPNLMLVPSYTDEDFEVLWGLNIALGRHFPLNGYPPHYGPLFAYLIAALVRLFGTSVELPRLMIAVFGSLTVAATFALARVIQDRAAGIVSAGFTLTSPLLVAVASHQGWSSGLTPFFATATALALYVGVTRKRNGLLVLSGLLAAFTLQTHATTAAVLLGLFVWFLAQPNLRQRLRQPAPYLVLLLFVAGYAPMIIANARLDSPLLQAANNRSYAFAPTLDPLEYLSRATLLLRLYSYFVGGGLDPPTLFLRAQAVAVEVFSLAGLIWAWRRGIWLMPLTILTMALILPIVVVTGGYRYSMALIPMAHVLMGLFAVAIFRALYSASFKSSLNQVARLLVVVLVAGLVLFPLYTISEYYRNAFANGWTNQGYFELERTARAQGACGPRFYIEDLIPKHLDLEDYSLYIALSNVNYVLTLDGCEHRMAEQSVIAQELSASHGGWLVIPEQGASFFNPLNLELIATISVPHDESIVPISFYRVVPHQ